MNSNVILCGYRRAATYLLLALVLLMVPHLSACGGTSDNDATSINEDAEDIIPVIFIPGITGSILMSPSPSTILWPPGGPGADIDYSSLRDDFWRLSLNPSTGPHEDIYPTDVIREYGDDPIYSLFLNFLIEEGGYVEYDVHGNPARRTVMGANYGQKPKPSLFVFAYDWRLPIEDNARILSEYVKVINRYYPDKKVNIVTHSMGGLVGRRYIIDNPGKVNKLITIAAPFLGSAKPLYQMVYGKLSAPAYYGKEATSAGLAEFLTGGPVLDMLAYYPGLHELMSSRGYFALGGPPYSKVETLAEAAGDLKLPETKEVSFTELMGSGGIVDHLFPNPNANGKSPARTNVDFHSYSANGNNQDDWSKDTTGVKYYHLIGVQSTNDTPLSIREAQGYSAAQVRDYALNLYGPGDGTVPRLSAERKGNGQDYNAPNARLYIYKDGPDSLLEHTGIMKNNDVLFKVLEILQGKEEKPPAEVKQWTLKKMDSTAKLGEPIYWKDDQGRYSLTMTASGNTVTHKHDSLRGDEVTDSLVVTVQHDIPSHLPEGEMVETRISWQMTATGTPRYNSGAIEIHAGTSRMLQPVKLNENPTGEMVYKWRTQGIGTSNITQKFDISLNLRFTSSDYGRVKFTFVYP